MRHRGFWRKGLAEVKPDGNRAGLGRGCFCVRFGFWFDQKFAQFDVRLVLLFLPYAIVSLFILLSAHAHSELLVMADLNLHWLSRASDDLNVVCNELNLTQMISEPMRPNTKNPKKSIVIDVILTHRPHKYISNKSPSTSHQ